MRRRGGLIPRPRNVTNNELNTVSVITGTTVVATIAHVGEGPAGIALTPDHQTAYVADFGFFDEPSHTVTPEAEAPIPLPGTSPRAIAIAPDGHTAYVLDAAHATIIPIQLPARTVGAPVDLVCTKFGDPGCTPTALTIAPGGRSAYIAAAGSGDVVQLSLPTLSVTRVIPTGGYPDALGLSGKWLFVGNAASNTVSVFHASHPRVDVRGVTYPFGIGVVPGS